MAKSFLSFIGWSSSEPPEDRYESRSRADIMKKFGDQTIKIIAGSLHNGEPVTLYYMSHRYPEGSELKDNEESFPFAGEVASRLWTEGYDGVRPVKLSLIYKRDGDNFVISGVEGLEREVYAGSHNIMVDDFSRIVQPDASFNWLDSSASKLMDSFLTESLGIFYAFPSPRETCIDVYKAINIRSFRQLHRALREKAKGSSTPGVSTEDGMPTKYAGILRRADAILAFAEHIGAWDEDMENAFDKEARDARLLTRLKVLREHRNRVGFSEHWRKRSDRRRALRKKPYTATGDG